MAVAREVATYWRWPGTYMFRAYQSPYSGTHCGPQCAHMPNFASRNQSGVWYCASDAHVGWKSATRGAAGWRRETFGSQSPAAATAPVWRNSRRVGGITLLCVGIDRSMRS